MEITSRLPCISLLGEIMLGEVLQIMKSAPRLLLVLVVSDFDEEPLVLN
jgi:hypothetical protein